jgi:hypothetical protein
MFITMDKFKYEIYDYSKVGIPKTRVLHRKCVSLWEYNALRNAHYSKSEMAEFMFKSLKKKFEMNRPKIYDYSPNFNFDYEIIIRDETYTFHETSGKKE